MDKVRFWRMSVTIQLTWSKLMALFLLIAAVYLDKLNGGYAVTMYESPFIVALILGKQANDTIRILKEK